MTRAEAAQLLGQCERSLHRQIERYEADGWTDCWTNDSGRWRPECTETAAAARRVG